MKIFAVLLCSTCAAMAQTYNFTGLSTDDVLIIGRGLDKLLGTDPTDRLYTDRSRLWDRIQAQINQQNNAMAAASLKAKADADKTAIDAAVAEAMAKTKAAIEKAAAEAEAIEKAKKETPQ